MSAKNVLSSLTEKCDLYFEGSLISKERIIEKYADFFASSIGSEERSVSIALHTGSICFDIVSFITAALGCIYLNRTNYEDIISSLNEGDMVIYKNKRYWWLGIEARDGDCYIKLQQDARGKNGPMKLSLLFDRCKNLIKPYLGESEVTDGRGLRKVKNYRADFISHIFGVQKDDIPSITGVSTVIVTERYEFKRIAEGLKIHYGDSKIISLLDIVTASYFTEGGEEYQFGNNPAKTEPVLKITGKVSAARDLVLDKHGNPVVGLMVIGSNALTKGGSELADLLGRKSLKFIHLVTDIDFKGVEEIIETQLEASVFACTKDFLLDNFLPLREQNPLTLELDKQIGNIVKNTLSIINVPGCCSWEEMKKVKETLYTIKRSNWSDDNKNDFIINAHALLNLLTTAMFPFDLMEKVLTEGRLHIGVTSPEKRISVLWELANQAGSMEYFCAYIAEIIERIYKSQSETSPKCEALIKHLSKSGKRKVAIVVPKAYYVDLLTINRSIIDSGVDIVSVNRFDSSVNYDEIIAVGDIWGKCFDPLKCKAAEDIVVLLFECEAHVFRHKRKKAQKFEKKLNRRGQYNNNGLSAEDFDELNDTQETKEIEKFIENSLDLERYINAISAFDIKKFATCESASGENASISEVCVVGKFTGGEQILFSKYYNAVVFNSLLGSVVETEPEKLVEGDVLIFTKRDNYTKNMVDYIYEGLQTNKRLSREVLDATEKAAYWKESLREYKENHRLSYRDIAERLRNIGSLLQEVSIRQWLIEESHIVGPRDKKTMEQIAEMTGDSYLQQNVHDYFEACRIVRRQRKEILELIGKAITDRLRGHMPVFGSLLESVYKNVENLSESLELESIVILDEPIFVPINLINKPLSDVEVSL